MPRTSFRLTQAADRRQNPQSPSISSQCFCICLGGQWSPDRLTDGGHYLLLGRKSPELASGNDLAVDFDLERPTWPLAQLGKYPKLLLERGRRTGGPGQITSRITIDDSD